MNMKTKQFITKNFIFVLAVLLLMAFTGCKKTYEVKFDSAGGSSVETQEVKKNGTVTKPANPTKEGYEFENWLLDGTAYDFNAKVTSSFTLVASWKEVVNPQKATIEITSDKDVMEYNGSIKFEVTVTNANNNAYTLSTNYDDLVQIENNVLTLKTEITLDKFVTVTATLTEDPTVKASKSITIKAPIVEGQVGELTSDMLKEIGNQSITVTGVLTDYYRDFKNSANNSTNAYDMVVKMNDGVWYGEWNHQLAVDNKMVDYYRRSEKDGYRDSYGNVGHALERLYINKNNELASAIEKNYNSFPVLWEQQHLWNHLANLQITKFKYDAENDVYEYKADLTQESDLYLMTYLSFSLTPVLFDTLDKLYLKVENGKVTQLLAQTEILYYGSNTEEDPDAMSYSDVKISFSNVGTTVVESPKPFDAPDYADKLQAALEKMQNAKNYTFRAADTQTSAPSGDSGDYELSATSFAAKGALVSLAVKDFVSSVGTVGCYGLVTEDAILFANTGKYSYSMDGNDYFTNYSGYKQNTDGTYDEFKYNSTLGALEGTKKVNGNIFDVMPKFDLSPNIFIFETSSIKNGVTTYTFRLNETAIARDVAKELSAYKYAANASSSSSTAFRIVVSDNGDLVSTTFPYDLISGTYIGYCTTTYSNVGTTALEEDTFTGYVPRVVKTSWDQYTTKYYSPDCSTLTSRDENTAIVLEDAYGVAASSIPDPTVFLTAFGDNISGPFFDWKEKGVDSDGNPIYSKFISIVASSTDFDENAKILNFDEIIEVLGEELEKLGFQLSIANTDTSGGELGQSNRYVCYVNEDIQIVIENNHTKYFWIYFYKTGEWTLK